MPVKPSRITVTTAPTRIDAAETALSMAVMFRNRGNVAVFVGGADVAASTGYRLDPSERMSLMLRPGDGGVWAVTESGTAEVHRIQLTGG